MTPNQVDVPDTTESESENATASFTVDEEGAGARLDAYLAAHIDGWSRARLQRLIDEEEVLVNGKLVKASYKVSAGDEIEVELAPPATASFTPELCRYPNTTTTHTIPQEHARISYDVATASAVRLSPATLSAQDHLTSELLRTL